MPHPNSPRRLRHRSSRRGLVVRSRGSAATIVVNSVADTVADDGSCTLREALAAATTNVASGATPGECTAGEPLPAVDTIAFAIPGSGVHTIQPTSTMAAHHGVRRR